MDLQSEICETVEEKIQSGIHKITAAFFHAQDIMENFEDIREFFL
jgi:hypothetical protein